MIYYDSDIVKKYIFPSQKIILAVSGGVDSIAGAHFLISQLGRSVDFSILHINNHLVQSDEESADRVYDFGRSLGVNVYIRTALIDKLNKRGIEAACRDSRLKVYREIGGGFVIFHHLDDAVESYLMNVFRGHVNYLPIRKFTCLGFNNAYLIRPFVSSTCKLDFIDYAKKNDLFQWVVEDELNESSRRGWIRNKLLPVVSEQYPGLVSVVRRMYDRRENK